MTSTALPERATLDGSTFAPPPRSTSRDGGTPTGPSAAPAVDRRALAYASVCLLALLSSFTSLWNGFTYDDVDIVFKNERVHALTGWWHLFQQAWWPPPTQGGLYRPLTMLSFAVQWTVGHGAPWIFHAVNVALYVAVCAAVLRLARLMMARPYAWIAAALFAVHPVHVEAVGNVVGQAELLAALAMTVAVGEYVAMRRAGPPTMWASLRIVALYAVAAFSKEHGVLLPAILVAAECYLCRDAEPRAWRTRTRALLPLAVALGAVGVAFIFARASVPAVLLGQKYTALLGHFAPSVRLYAFFTVVPEWVRLFYWPASLSIDYSPQHLMIPLQWTGSLIGGAAITLLLLGVTALAMVRERVIAFCLLWCAVTLALPSGLFVAIGTLLAERTLFTPSVGAMLVVGAALEAAARRKGVVEPMQRRAVLVTLAALVAAGAWQSAQRQRIWKDNETLFAQGVIDAPLSWHTHYSRGGWLFEHHRFPEGERELRMAIRLFPVDPDPMDLLASQYFFNGMCKPAIPLLRDAAALKDMREYTTTRERRILDGRLVSCYLAEKRFDEASSYARRRLERDRADTAMARMLRVADSALARATTPPR